MDDLFNTNDGLIKRRVLTVDDKKKSFLKRKFSIQLSEHNLKGFRIKCSIINKTDD